jgi:DNA modification methylase
MNKLFSDFDFSSLDSPDFKEDSVREDLIMPILKELGYSSQSENKIIRSKSVRHKFVQTGSGKHKLNSVPDYLLEVGGKYAWVLDAKAPNEDIKTGKNVEQAYFYAIHSEIRVDFYALCNGREFILFHISQPEAALYFPLPEIEKHWHEVEKYLSPNAFDKTQTKFEKTNAEIEFDYLSKNVLNEIRSISKQSSKRHYGVHGYFTKQAYQVVQAYIRNFTKPNDLVLDPFGGTGVTAVEALMIGRRAIHVDLNPLSVFFVKNLINPISLNKLETAFRKVQNKFQKLQPKTEEEVENALKTYPYPQNVKMPAGSDFEFLEQAFTNEQLAELAILKHIILEENDKEIRDVLLLMFSSSLNKFNLTYHASAGRSEGRGNSSIFAMYRYRKAPEPGRVGLWNTFEGKLKKIINAKREMLPLINEQTIHNAQVIKGTATNLEKIENNTVDYIYTDPPYGKKIQYLDLSIMWNAWLDFKVSEEDYELEAIEGGEHHKTKDDYSNLLAESIREMYRVLKFDRWMSFVFAHKDPEYWHLIVDTAEKAGFEYAGAVKQNNGQTSFKKRQHPFTVLSGQLIINFKKVRNPKSIMKADLGGDITDLIIQSIEGIIAKNSGATLEEINDELIIRGLELGFLDVLSKKYQDITPFLLANFDYHDDTETYHLKKNSKFKAHIPIELRIKYYVVSMMRRLARQNEYPSFDDIILEIMPLLRNGVTPEHQTILSVLDDIAIHVGGDQWKLKESGQGNLFDLV